MTYTLEVTNLGPSVSTGGTVTDDLPVGLTFESSPGGCAEAGGTVTCSFGTLPVGGSESMQFSAAVESEPPASISNTAIVTGQETDSVTGNNEATEITLVDRLASVSVEYWSRSARPSTILRVMRNHSMPPILTTIKWSRPALIKISRPLFVDLHQVTINRFPSMGSTTAARPRL